MIYPELSRWIAQSESWQAFIDYNVPDEEKASYVFLERSGDFYISLLSKLQDALESFFENESEHNKADLLAIAKGLEIYSLKGKRENFYGINYKRNMLYVASLYYLCDYPATSFLLLKQFREEDFSTSVELFIYYFLSRNYNRKQAQLNPYFSSILDYLREGNVNRISDLDKLFSTILMSGSIESHLFVLTYIARGILRKFRSNNIWFDLFEFAPDIDWKPFVRYNIGKSPQVWSFFPSQQAAIRGGILTFERAFSLQTPTSSGKTSISELIIFNELSRRPDAKILYLAPFRALASELKLNLGKNLSSKLGIKIKTIYGGNIVTDSERFGIAQSNVLISTPEKFMAIEMALKGVFDEFQVVICDEGHLIDSSSRGISYELLLSRLKRNEVIERRFVFLSAIVPNIEVINAWLGGSDKDIARSNYRPTEIELAFLVPVENRRFNLVVNPQSPLPKKYILNNFLSDSDFELGRKSYNPSSYKSKSVSSALKSLNSGAVAIFSPTKDSSQGAYGLAAEIIKQLGTKLPNPITYADAEFVRDLTEFFSSIFGGSFILTLSARHGFLFHHGDLPQFVREIVENAVRRERIKLLVCTSTLSEGVNLPIKTLVISNTRRYNADTNSLVSIPIRDLKNLIGRAGRAGKETRGTVIVVNPADREILLNVLANRNLEDVRGFLFHVTQVIEQVIVRAGTELSNEMLDTLRQSDHIDSAIIQLLAEDITVEGLNEAVSTLMENTLTFFQSEDNIKGRLRQLFELRAEKVRDAIADGTIYYIRRSGISLRNYGNTERLIDVNADFLVNMNDPLNIIWLDYLFDILYSIKDFTDSIPKKSSGVNSEFYTRQDILAGIDAWMRGSWYEEISIVLGVSVERCLEFFSFVEFKLQSIAASIIKYIEMKRDDADNVTSATIINWPNFLIYGVSSNVEMDLVDINIPDRLLVLGTSSWLQENRVRYDGRESLRGILKDNRQALTAFLAARLPRLSMIALENYFSEI